MWSGYYYVVAKTGLQLFIGQALLKLGVTLLPLSPKNQDYTRVPPYLDKVTFYIFHFIPLVFEMF